jgi:hypothetical protein
MPDDPKYKKPYPTISYIDYINQKEENNNFLSGYFRPLQNNFNLGMRTDKKNKLTGDLGFRFPYNFSGKDKGSVMARGKFRLNPTTQASVGYEQNLGQNFNPSGFRIGFTKKFREGGKVSPQKAKKILSDGQVHGKALTPKQQRFFGAMSNYNTGGPMAYTGEPGGPGEPTKFNTVMLKGDNEVLTDEKRKAINTELQELNRANLDYYLQEGKLHDFSQQLYKGYENNPDLIQNKEAMDSIPMYGTNVQEGSTVTPGKADLSEFNTQTYLDVYTPKKNISFNKFLENTSGHVGQYETSPIKPVNYTEILDESGNVFYAPNYGIADAPKLTYLPEYTTDVGYRNVMNPNQDLQANVQRKNVRGSGEASKYMKPLRNKKRSDYLYHRNKFLYNDPRTGEQVTFQDLPLMGRRKATPAQEEYDIFLKNNKPIDEERYNIGLEKNKQEISDWTEATRLYNENMQSLFNNAYGGYINVPKAEFKRGGCLGKYKNGGGCGCAKCGTHPKILRSGGYPSGPYYPYPSANLRVDKNYDKNHVQPTVFENGGNLPEGKEAKYNREREEAFAKAMYEAQEKQKQLDTDYEQKKISYNDYTKKVADLEASLKKEEKRVQRVRDNVLKVAQELEAKKDRLFNTNYKDLNKEEKAAVDFYYNKLGSGWNKEEGRWRTKQEHDAIIKEMPQLLKDILPKDGRYDLYRYNKFDAKGNLIADNPKYTSDRGLYCTPGSTDCYQRAGAYDMPILSGNPGFAKKAYDDFDNPNEKEEYKEKEGDIPFQRIPDSEAVPGDMALLYGYVPVDYADLSKGYTNRVHHTTIASDIGDLVNGEAPYLTSYSPAGGSRLLFSNDYYDVSGEKNVRGEDSDAIFYRYVGQTPKIKQQIATAGEGMTTVMPEHQLTRMPSKGLAYMGETDAQAAAKEKAMRERMEREVEKNNKLLEQNKMKFRKTPRIMEKFKYSRHGGRLKKYENGGPGNPPSQKEFDAMSQKDKEALTKEYPGVYKIHSDFKSPGVENAPSQAQFDRMDQQTKEIMVARYPGRYNISSNTPTLPELEGYQSFIPRDAYLPPLENITVTDPNQIAPIDNTAVNFGYGGRHPRNYHTGGWYGSFHTHAFDDAYKYITGDYNIGQTADRAANWIEGAAEDVVWNVGEGIEAVGDWAGNTWDSLTQTVSDDINKHSFHMPKFDDMGYVIEPQSDQSAIKEKSAVKTGGNKGAATKEATGGVKIKQGDAPKIMREYGGYTNVIPMTYANGGNMGQFSSVPVTEFNNGGSHEANPLGGIPQGPGARVEEGELKITIPGTEQQFIVSPKIKLDKTTAEEFGIPSRYVGKDMVKIFKSVLKKDVFNQREGDTIDNHTQELEIMPFVEAHTYLTDKKNAEEEAKKQAAFGEDMDRMMNEYPEYMQALMAQQQPQQQGPSPEEQAMMEQQMMAQQGAPQGMPMMGMGGMMEYKNGGLWANIHAKRARIKAGSGERMRKPGSKGAPTNEAIKNSQKAMGGYLYKNGGYDNAGFKALPDYVQAKIKGNSMAYGGAITQPVKIMDYPQEDMIMNYGGNMTTPSYSDFIAPQQTVPVQGVAGSNFNNGGQLPPEAMQQITQETAAALQQGAQPQEIIAQLLQTTGDPQAVLQVMATATGANEQTAMQQIAPMIEQVATQMQQGQQQQMPQQMPMAGGGYMPYQSYKYGAGMKVAGNVLDTAAPFLAAIPAVGPILTPIAAGAGEALKEAGAQKAAGEETNWQDIGAKTAIGAGSSFIPGVGGLVESAANTVYDKTLDSSEDEQARINEILNDPTHPEYEDTVKMMKESKKSNKAADITNQVIGTAGQIASGVTAANMNKASDTATSLTKAGAAAGAPEGTTVQYTGNSMMGAGDSTNYSSFAPGYTAGPGGEAVAVSKAYGGKLYANGGDLPTGDDPTKWTKEQRKAFQEWANEQEGSDITNIGGGDYGWGKGSKAAWKKYKDQYLDKIKSDADTAAYLEQSRLDEGLYDINPQTNIYDTPAYSDDMLKSMIQTNLGEDPGIVTEGTLGNEENIVPGKPYNTDYYWENPIDEKDNYDESFSDVTDRQRETTYLKPTLAQNMLSGIPGAFNVARGLMPGQDLDLGRVSLGPAKLVDLEQSRRDAQQLYASTQKAMKNAAGGGGNYMANLAGAYNNYLSGLNRINQAEQTANAQIINERNKQQALIDAQNIGLSLKEQDWAAKQRAARENLIGQGLTQWLDIAKGNQQNKFLAQSYFPAIAEDYAEFYKWQTEREAEKAKKKKT